MLLTLLAILFTLGYVLLILAYLRAWRQLPECCPEPQKEGRISLSVIVPARDEAGNIGRCIESLAGQTLTRDRFEVLIADDHSTDDTVRIAEEAARDSGWTNVRVLRMSEIPLAVGEVAYKKRAIEMAVREAQGEVVVTTDADCTHHPDWLKSLAAAFEDQPVDMVSGPVVFENDGRFFQTFQALDFLGMIGITAASLKMGMFNLANGANLAFRRNVFLEVGGYSGIDHKASGDDMLLIYKIAQSRPGRVLFLKSPTAVVHTRPAETLSEFVEQRLRWTSKSFSYQDRRITRILAFVYLTNLLLPVLITAAVVSGEPEYLAAFALQFIFMSAVDYTFLREMTGYFDRRLLLRWFWPSQFLHVVYIVVIGLLGNLLPYRWKGRKLR